MTRRLGVFQAFKLHTTAASAGGGVLVLGFLGPVLPILKRTEDLVSFAMFGLLIVITTFVLSAPFTFIFWLTYNSDRPLTKSVAALVGASTAVLSFLLLFAIAGEAPKFSSDFILTFGLLVFAGVLGGLLFRWRLIAMAKRLAGKA